VRELDWHSQLEALAENPAEEENNERGRRRPATEEGP